MVSDVLVSDSYLHGHFNLRMVFDFDQHHTAVVSRTEFSYVVQHADIDRDFVAIVINRCFFADIR